MAEVELQAAKRKLLGKAVSQLRKAGKVPGVVYGQGTAATPIETDGRAVEKAYRQAGISKLVKLEIGGQTLKNALFHEVQQDPLTQKILHFDLYAVKMDEKIRTEAPLYFEGEAPAVHKHQALLLKPLETVEVEALPKDLPEHIPVDISGLEEIEQEIFVKDLKVPAGVSILNDPEELVVKVEAQREEEVEEELPPEGAEAEVVEAEHGGGQAEEPEAEEGESSPPSE